LDLSALLAHAAIGAPILEDERAHDLREAMMSLLAVQVARHEPLAALGGLADSDPRLLAALEVQLAAAIAKAGVATPVIERHSGISPQAMGRLLSSFASEPVLADLLVDSPAEPNAALSYRLALDRCVTHLGAPFGGEKRQWQLAYLITDWMRGRPLASLIRRRIELSPQPRVDAIIRETMTDVENVARFQAPKFLACYLDLLRLYLSERGQRELADDAPDLDMLLELGVSQPTQMRLLGLGLSRTTAIAVTEFMLGENLSRLECVAWLQRTDFESLPLPKLVRKELSDARERLRSLS
jgi:hypothetical protein